MNELYNGDISQLRLINQQIISPSQKTVKELIRYMGAMQAQDFAMASWAVGVRLENSTVKAFEECYNNGEILRTHLLRPTWHFVSQKDINWILDLTAPHILPLLKGRHRNLGLKSEILNNCNSVMGKALSGGQHLTRDELLLVFQKNKVPVERHQLSHIFLNAELHKVICSGRVKNKKITYALFDERATDRTALPKEEALARLTRIYFTSHGPALQIDFQWWSGLSATNAKKGIASIEGELASHVIGEKTFYYAKENSLVPAKKDAVFVLPAFDEYIISYRNRSAILAAKEHAQVVSSNGIFRPFIVQNGQVIGIWGRTTKKETIIIDLDFFQSPTQKVVKTVKQKLMEYGKFLGKKVEIRE